MSQKTLRIDNVFPFLWVHHVRVTNVFPALWELLPPSYSPGGKRALQQEVSLQNSESCFMSLVLTGLLLRENGKRIKSFLGPNHGDYFQVVGQSKVLICRVPEGPTTGSKAQPSSSLLLQCLEKSMYLKGGMGLPSRSAEAARLSCPRNAKLL